MNLVEKRVKRKEEEDDREKLKEAEWMNDR